MPNNLSSDIQLWLCSLVYHSLMLSIDLFQTFIASLCHIMKLIDLSNVTTTNLAFLTMEFEDVKDFEDSLRVDCGIDEPEIESPNMIFRKSFTFINL